MIRVGVLAAALAGCAPRPAAPPAPVRIQLVPMPVAAPAAALAPTANAPSAAAILRDTAALQDQATAYVARRDSKPAVIDQLTALTTQVRSAVQRMQANRSRAGYRRQDVTTARAAADGLAAYLHTAAGVK